MINRITESLQGGNAMQSTVEQLSEGAPDVENLDGIVGKIMGALTIEEILALFTKNYGALPELCPKV